MKRRCDHCTYWERHGKPEFNDEPIGECRREPPRVVVVKELYRRDPCDFTLIDLLGQHPATYANHWCGAFTPIPISEQQP